MRGHEGRVFSVGWSPLQPHIVFSASEDQTARMWDYSAQPDRAPPGFEPTFYCYQVLIPNVGKPKPKKKSEQKEKNEGVQEIISKVEEAESQTDPQPTTTTTPATTTSAATPESPKIITSAYEQQGSEHKESSREMYKIETRKAETKIDQPQIVKKPAPELEHKESVKKKEHKSKTAFPHLASEEVFFSFFDRLYSIFRLT